MDEMHGCFLEKRPGDLTNKGVITTVQEDENYTKMEITRHTVQA